MRSIWVALVVLSIAQSVRGQGVIHHNDFSNSGNIHVGGGISEGNWFDHFDYEGVREESRGNQYARIDVTIKARPTDPGSRWNVGLFEYVSDFRNEYTDWRLTFDIRVTSLQPVLVSLVSDNGGSPHSGPLELTETKYWITPSSLEWENIVIDQSTEFISREPGGFNVGGDTPLTWMLSSHDQDGMPLQISELGTHTFYVDNISLIVVPEPSVFALMALGFGALSFFSSGRKGKFPERDSRGIFR